MSEFHRLALGFILNFRACGCLATLHAAKMTDLIFFRTNGFSGAFVDRLLHASESVLFLSGHAGRQSKREN
jgi:hypothetical protein